MRIAGWLIIFGAVFLLAGLVTALVSTHYEGRVMGKAALGVAILAPDEGSPEWKEKEALRVKSDRWFWLGIGLTALGVIVQTIGSLLALK